MSRHAVALLAAAIVWAMPASAAAEPAVAEGENAEAKNDEGPYPLEYWALRPVVQNVRVSPDGKRLGLMRIATRDGNPVIEIYDAGDMQKKPFRMDADPMEIEYFYWVSDKHLLFQARQQVRKVIDDFNQGVWRQRFGMLNIEKKKVSNFGTGCMDIASLLPAKPHKVIVSVVSGGCVEDRGSVFRPPAYYELDLEKGTKKLLVRGRISRSGYAFDGEGNPWLTLGFDERKKEFIWYHRRPGAKDWKEIHRQHEDDFNDFNVEGFDVDHTDKLFVTANYNDNTSGLWSVDMATGDKTLIHRRKDIDIGSVLFTSQQWTDPGRVVGYLHIADRLQRHYIDKVAGATHAHLMEAIPNAYDVRITSRSRDGATLTVSNSGPRDPGRHYLLKDGRLQLVGKTQPLLEHDRLADVEYITYKARDGEDIRAYLTVPHGEPPFPLVVLPHGGPFVPEYVAYDKWGQALANNGYMVLQPQYRGSRNFGQAFYQMAFMDAKGGQGGYKMQDDKDDGALHLVKSGRADPERLAMFGWSYGGYAAGVAAARTPQIYQCVVAGAAVFDTLQQVNYYRDRMRGAQELEQTRMWDDSISPIKEVAKVNVPMLIVHGDVDQRVPVEHARKYIKELDKHGKAYKYVELAGADHFSNTLTFDHQLDFYTAMMDFLANDCGPDGL